MTAWTRAGLVAILLLSSLSTQAVWLLNADFNDSGFPSGTTYSGAAVLGQDGDVWNGVSQGYAEGPFYNSSLVLASNDAAPVSMSYAFTWTAYDVGDSTPFYGTAYHSLLRDYITGGYGGGWVQLSGLTPDAAYDLVLYSAANLNAAGRTTLFTVGGVEKTAVFDASVDTLQEGVNYVRYAAQADASGALLITFVGQPNPDSEGDLNGFQLAEASSSIPEPAALPILAAFGWIAGVAVRRTRRT